MSNQTNRQQNVSRSADRRVRISLALAVLLATSGLATTASAGLLDRARAAAPVVSKKVDGAKARIRAAKPKAPPSPKEIVQKIDAMMDAMPKPKEILGKTKGVIDESVGQAVDQLQDMRSELQRFKGAGCGPRQNSPCAQLKRRLKSVYTNMRGVADIVPGYEFLPAAATGFDPMGGMIDKIPAAPLYGMSLVFQELSVLDDLEMISVWVDQLHFYSIQPIEEDIFYRLGEEDCAILERSLHADNEIFDRMKQVMGVTKTVSSIAAEICPKDITINAWVGGSFPNPVLPVLVLTKQVAGDFEKFLDVELETRGKLVKQCRAQQFREDVQYKLDSLLGH